MCSEFNKGIFLCLFKKKTWIDMCQILAEGFKRVRQTSCHNIFFYMKCSDYIGIKLMRKWKQCWMTTLFGTVLDCAYILPHCCHGIIDKMWCLWHVQEHISLTAVCNCKPRDYSWHALIVRLKPFSFVPSFGFLPPLLIFSYVLSNFKNYISDSFAFSF